MTKKFYLVGMAIILTVSLFLIGCPTDADDDTVSGGNNVTQLPDGVPREDRLATNESELTAALNADSVKVVGFKGADVVTLAAELTIGKPLILYTPVALSKKIVIKSPVYVISHGVLNVHANGATIQDDGSISVHQGGELIVEELESVNNGDPQSSKDVWVDKVQIFGKLTIDAATADKIQLALSYVADDAELEVTASSKMPSQALALVSDLLPSLSKSAADVSGFGLSKSITEDSTGKHTNNKVTVVANADETATTLTIRENVAIRTSGRLDLVTALTVGGGFEASTATLPKLTTLTVSGELAAPRASGDPVKGLVIDVGAASTVDFGTQAATPIAKILTGSSVASGGTLKVGKVDTIEAIAVNGGFDTGDVKLITSLTLASGATLGIGNVDAIAPGGIKADAGAKVNGTEATADNKEDFNDPAKIPAKPATNPEDNAEAEALRDALGKDAVAASSTSVRLNGNATLSQNVTVPSGITLFISNGATLTISDGVTLTAEGTLKAADGTVAKIVLVGTGMVTGAAFYAADESALTPVAGVYDWSATAGGEDTAGWKQTALDVSTTYSLVEDAANNTTNPAASGISIATVLKDIATGDVTIKLKGEIDGKYVSVVAADPDGEEGATTATLGEKWYTADWGPSEESNWDNATQEIGVYGTVAIKGLFPAALSTHAVEIKPYPALGYYKGVQETQTALVSPAGPNEVNFHYIPADLTARQKWRYSASRAQDAIFNVILVDKGTPAERIVKLDIVTYTGSEGSYAKGAGILKATIDYSDVEFPTAAIEAEPSS
jgi:hypothetical protein